MKNVIHIIIFFLLVWSACSCCVFNKTKTQTVTQTITHVDTLIKVVIDTVPVVKTGTIHDTIFIENSTAKVKAFFDIKKQKIVVQLTGKPFFVPIKIATSHITITDVVKKEKKPNFYLAAAFLILGLVVISIIYNLIFKSKK